MWPAAVQRSSSLVLVNDLLVLRCELLYDDRKLSGLKSFFADASKWRNGITWHVWLKRQSPAPAVLYSPHSHTLWKHISNHAKYRANKSLRSYRPRSQLSWDFLWFFTLDRYTHKISMMHMTEMDRMGRAAKAKFRTPIHVQRLQRPPKSSILILPKGHD